MTDDTLPRVIAIVRGKLPIDHDTRLDELGLDDLTQVEIWDAIEAEFGFSADDMHWADVETIGDVVKLVDARGGK